MALAGISEDSSRSGLAVRDFLIHYLTEDMDTNSAAAFFHEDITLNGMIFQAHGRDRVVNCLMSFIASFVASLSVQAVTRVIGTQQFLVIFDCVAAVAAQEEGGEEGEEEEEGEEVPFCSVMLLGVDEIKGQIIRIDECFDVERISPLLAKQFEGIEANVDEEEVTAAAAAAGSSSSAAVGNFDP